MIGAAGSFAAISTLLGSPLVGAFLLMEAAGIGGAMMAVVLIPGLLAAGIGALIFVGLDSWTGYGTLLAGHPRHPAVHDADGAPSSSGPSGSAWPPPSSAPASAGRRCCCSRSSSGGWLLLMPSSASRSAALRRRLRAGSPTTPRPSAVLRAGRAARPDRRAPPSWTVGALILLMVCKGIAYALALSGFRGGPIFPGMFIGAAGGIALSHLAGLP